MTAKILNLDFGLCPPQSTVFTLYFRARGAAIFRQKRCPEQLFRSMGLDLGCMSGFVLFISQEHDVTV